MDEAGHALPGQAVETGSERERHEIGTGLVAHLFAKRGEATLDCLPRAEESRGHVLDREVQGDEAQHLDLGVGQLAEHARVGGPLGPADVFLVDLGCEGRKLAADHHTDDLARAGEGLADAQVIDGPTRDQVAKDKVRLVVVCGPADEVDALVDIRVVAGGCHAQVRRAGVARRGVGIVQPTVAAVDSDPHRWIEVQEGVECRAVQRRGRGSGGGSLALDGPGLTNRKRAEVLTAYADALAWLDRLDEARERYQAALKADPFFAAAQEGLGWVHWLEKDYAAATAAFQAALDLSPSSDALGGLASAQFKADAIDAEEAITLFDAALAIEPNNRWVWRQKGWMLMREETFEAAREAFQAAVDLNDQDAEALEGLSLAHYHLDEDEAALTHINAAIAAAPSTPGYVQRRSMVLLALDRPAAALRDADAYLEERPEAAIGYVRKGDRKSVV